MYERLYITSVPAANFSNSNTPIGPFQIIVWVVSNAALKVLMASGPISRPIQSSGIAVAGTICKHVQVSTKVKMKLLACHVAIPTELLIFVAQTVE